MWVALAVLVIFCTIPVARALREVVDSAFGRDIFLYAGFAMLCAGAGLAVTALRRRRLPASASIGLAVVLGLFAALIYALREIP